MPTELENAVNAGDAALVVRLLAPMTEADRRAEAPALIALLRKIKKDQRGTWGPQTYVRESTASLAVQGTASLTEIKSVVRFYVEEGVFDVLVARRPPWLLEWAEWSLRESEQYRSVQVWPFVRRMVKEGLIPRPNVDMYYLAMADRAKQNSVKEFLLSDPDLLDYDVWQLFRIEGNQQFSMSGIEKYGRSKWTASLIELMNDGVLDRNRLLDASLDALSRDFPEFRSGWFSRFHEALSPTIDERLVRQTRYLELIGSKIPPTVSFALNAVAALDKAGAITGRDCVDAVSPAFFAAEKKIVTQTLKLLAGWVKRDQELKPRAVDIAAPALEHGARDVREAVLAFMTANGYSPASETTANGLVDEPIDQEQPLELTPIAPIETVEDLVDAFAQCIETEGPPDDLERVLDGVSRLCAERPSDFDRLTGPLRKRARKVVENTWPTSLQGYSVKDAFAGLAIAWLEGELPPVSNRPDPRGVARFIGARVREIAVRVARREAAILLATPTHEGGWIAPIAFVERVRESNAASTKANFLQSLLSKLSGQSQVSVDLLQALLRLQPDGREEALTSAAGLAGEIGDAVRHALGSDTATVGPSTALWFAASRARDPWADDPLVSARHRPSGPGTSVAGKIEFRWRHTESLIQSKTYEHHWAEFDLEPALQFDISKAEGEARIDVGYPTLLMLSTGSMEPSMMRWTSVVWPANRENWFAAGCRMLGNNLDWWGAEWGNICYLEPLLEHTTHLDGMAGVLLGLGLAAKETKEGWIAREALVAAVRDGRLDADLLGLIIGRLFSWDHIKIPRVAERVLQAARESTRHAQVIHEAVGKALSMSPPAESGALGAALDLFYELSILTNSRPAPPLLDFLRTIKGSNRSATMAKKLLSL